MLVVASDPFAISTMAHALYDILPFLDKTRASSFFALSSLFIPQTSICPSLKAIFNALFSNHTRGSPVAGMIAPSSHVNCPSYKATCLI